MFLRLIDTNILYDAFTQNQNTEKAIQVIDQPVCIFDGVLYELSNLLKNTVSSDFAVSIIEMILEHPEMFTILECETGDRQEALKIMRKYQTQLPKKDYSLCDSLQLVQAQKYNLELYTLDERMVFFDRSLVKVTKPY